MQATHQPRSFIVRPKFKRGRKAASAATPFVMSTYVGDEIRAFATIRDLALIEAEKLTNPLNLQRAGIANDFVMNAINRARTADGSQHLPQGDAAREQQRCEAVKVRLSLLHAHLDALGRDHAHAA